MKLNYDETFNADVSRAGLHKQSKSINGPNASFSANIISGIKSVGSFVLGYFKINDVDGFKGGIVTDIDHTKVGGPVYSVRLSMSGEVKQTTYVV